MMLHHRQDLRPAPPEMVADEDKSADPDQRSAASEQKLVRHRKADDAEDQQREDREIAVSRDPFKDCAFQLERIPKFRTAGYGSGRLRAAQMADVFGARTTDLLGITEKNS